MLIVIIIIIIIVIIPTATTSLKGWTSNTHVKDESGKDSRYMKSVFISENIWLNNLSINKMS